ncbi:hypothetical protein V6N13_038440 [Hibiscus sabdariffa]
MTLKREAWLTYVTPSLLLLGLSMPVGNVFASAFQLMAYALLLCFYFWHRLLWRKMLSVLPLPLPEMTSRSFGLQYRMPSSAALFEGLTGQLLLLIEIRCKETDPNAYINDLYESDDYSERSVQNFKSMHTPPFREVSNSFRSVKHNVEGKP